MSRRTPLNPDVWRLGGVSLLTDLSSEIVFSVFAVVFTTVAGASSALLGLIEGLADFSASALNGVAGWLSDRSGRRKPFALAGYAFSTLAKALLVVSTSLASLAAFRVVERLGKGFRGPPRDAWLAAISEGGARGYAFGVHKALDRAGAVIGPLLAWALLSAWGESEQSYARLFLVALLPAVLAVIVLACLRDRPAPPAGLPSPQAGWRALNPAFKRFLLPAGLFALGYYSIGFVLLRAHELGFGVAQVVLLYALVNAACVLAAPWVGRLGDRIGRVPVLMLGYASYGVVNLGLMAASARWQLVLLMVGYGVFVAIDESQSKALIADLEPTHRAGAIGAYNTLAGVLYLPASLLAGALWAGHATLVFGLAAALSLFALLALRGVRVPPR